MKRQFLNNFSTQFANQLNCSSIRIEADQQDNHPPHQKQQRLGNQLNSGPKLKKYEQNDIVGFQMSLSIEDNRQKFLELMRSKGIRQLKNSKQQKQQFSKRQKQNTAYGGSLYNTTSFDEQTMNITSNTKNNNAINIHNHTDSLQSDKTLQKTMKIPNLQAHNSDQQEKYVIKVNKIPPIKIEDQQPRKIPQKLLDSLKCSITLQQKNEKSFEQMSYEEPYFKVGSLSHLNSAGKIETHQNKLVAKNQKRQLSRVTSADHFKSVDKKLTLRDYMYLSQLSAKNREKGSTCQQPSSPQYSNSTARTVSRSRKKVISSNAQVMQQLKKRVMKDMELVQGNFNLLMEYISSHQTEEQVSKEQLMNMYNISRILKDKIVAGNDELVMMLQQLNKQ